MIEKLFVLLAVANLVLSQNTTCPANEGYTSLYPVASPLGTGWRCPGQQYTADFNGQVYSVDLWLSPFNGGGGNIYLEVYDALTTSSSNLVATSASIPGPSSGSWVTFTFSSTWTQSAGSTYYFYPRDPNPSSPRYSWTSNYWSNSSPLGSECAVYWCYGYALDCRNRFAFRVNYNKDSCCTPGCYNGGICQADGTCTCPTGYPLPSCLNTCAGSVSYTTNSGIAMPMGSSWLCPGQEYKTTQNGTVSSISLALDPFSGPGGNVYVEVYSAHSLSSTLIATSSAVAGPTSSGTFTTFTFATPWTQVQGQNYYFYPRDPTPSNPSYTWVLSSSGTLTEECLVTWCGNVYRDCRWRGKFIVNYSYSC